MQKCLSMDKLSKYIWDSKWEFVKHKGMKSWFKVETDCGINLSLFVNAEDGSVPVCGINPKKCTSIAFANQKISLEIKKAGYDHILREFMIHKTELFDIDDSVTSIRINNDAVNSFQRVIRNILKDAVKRWVRNNPKIGDKFYTDRLQTASDIIIVDTNTNKDVNYYMLKITNCEEQDDNQEEYIIIDDKYLSFSDSANPCMYTLMMNRYCESLLMFESDDDELNYIKDSVYIGHDIRYKSQSWAYNEFWPIVTEKMSIEDKEIQIVMNDVKKIRNRSSVYTTGAYEYFVNVFITSTHTATVVLCKRNAGPNNKRVYTDINGLIDDTIDIIPIAYMTFKANKTGYTYIYGPSFIGIDRTIKRMME